MDYGKEERKMSCRVAVSSGLGLELLESFALVNSSSCNSSVRRPHPTRGVKSNNGANHPKLPSLKS